ncbi:hypothetical protein FGO68_gene12790 [Halteria grandinella]|uniref:Protein kinase domain-containing protein n=1 Tax=Halteria grandinella TaxID=5974 RepID=A0A8J8NTR7_HALGN|nr:hypothetical protein FGO68_gene12790 [Halteria grandinella]
MEPAPKIIHGYKLIKYLGEGSFCETHLAVHMETHKQCALKIQLDLKTFDKRATCRQQIQNEIECLEKLKKLNYPFLVKFIESFPLSDNDSAYRDCIVLEYADGCDLRARMNALKKPISENQALLWFTEVILALARMEQFKYFHRDMKPDNILIFGEAFGGVAKVGDFGSTNKIDSTNMTLCVGTFCYLAPEKATKKYDEKSDVWSMAITLFEMITGGGHPIQFDFEERTLFEYMSELPHLPLKQMPSNISSACKDLITRMLQKNPNDRPSFTDIIRTPIIYSTVQLITEREILGMEIAEQIINYYRCIDLDISPLISFQVEEKKEIPNLPSKMSIALVDQPFSQLSLQPSPALQFTQQGLDDFLQQIRHKGDDKKNRLVDEAIQWGLSLIRLNNNSQNKEVKQLPFEGDQWHKSGLYYGEQADGKRDGYGLLYCINNYGWPYLFECHWKQGQPLRGKSVSINDDNQWRKYEGPFDTEYKCTGIGKFQREDGSGYEGGQKDGMAHGLGRQTFPNGNYLEGQQEYNKFIGIHKHFSKEGKLLHNIAYKNGKEVFREKA